MEMQRRISMLSLARSALTDDRILPFYQPKVDLVTGAVEGFEALLRWLHPGKDPQSPATIAAAFEDLSLAAEISDRMIGRVIEDAARWRDEGIRFHHVAVNAAAAEFRRGDFADKLLERLSRAKVPPSCLQVEVTETVFLGRGAECVERALRALSGAGVQIALDDFGTGYASLSHLKQFPVDIIKIDRSFVRDLEDGTGDAAIIDAVISLGRSLGIRIVAEGVENERQHSLLRSLGCDAGQGYFYGRAAPAGEVAAMLGARARRAAMAVR
jgi:EAL domain-containing protein (putative c-di-GMP-specific phosphodiesterase class I)